MREMKDSGIEWIGEIPNDWNITRIKYLYEIQSGATPSPDAFQILRQSNFDDMATEEFDNVQNLFAAILSKGIGQQLKQTQ